MFTPFRLRGMETRNRVMVSPMCQFAADDGLISDWHIAHLGAFAVGGAGIVFTEMTDVSADGRITPNCAGIYKPEHAVAWRRVAEFVHGYGAAKFGVQLAHAGPKASVRPPWERDKGPLTEDDGGWRIIGPSPIAYEEGGLVPKEMDRGDMDRVIADFARGARMAEEAGFDLIELHGAHGYLLSAFISPLMNRRTDEYGGSNANRARFPLEVFDAVRAAWPEEKPISVRISATDWIEGGLTPDDAVEIATMFKAHGADIVDASAGNTSTAAKPPHGPTFQAFLAEKIRREAGIATIAVGAITTPEEINSIVGEGRADLCALARMHLTDPHFTLKAAARYGYRDQVWPVRYMGAKMQAEALAEAARPRAAQ
jgi:anthraniloyl-CoA monooxygenase